MFCISFFMFDYSYYFLSDLAYNCCQAYKINPQLLFSVISSSSVGYCGLFLLLLPQLQVLLKIFFIRTSYIVVDCSWRLLSASVSGHLQLFVESRWRERGALWTVFFRTRLFSYLLGIGAATTTAGWNCCKYYYCCKQAKLSLFTFAYVPIFSDALFHINDYICNIIAFFNTQINLFQSDFSTKFAQSFAFPASSKLYHE